LDAKIQTLQKSYDALRSQVNFLQQKLIQLEASERSEQQNSKDLLSDTLNAPNDIKITQQGNYNYTLNSNMGSLRKKSFQENDTNFHQAQEASFKSLSEDSRIHFKNHQTTQQYNLPLKSEKGPNEQNFITLRQIPDQEKIEIIKLGFQHQAESKISLKKYYEGVSEANSLFQLKGYSIKYEAIRKNKLYQQFKP
jgi:hypothetical protein